MTNNFCVYSIKNVTYLAQAEFSFCFYNSENMNSHRQQKRKTGMQQELTYQVDTYDSL